MTTVPFRHQDGLVGSLPTPTHPEEPSPDTAASDSHPGLPLHRATAPADPLNLPEFERILAPQLALRSDAVVLVSLEALSGYDLAGRKRWVGIELTEDEAAELRRRFRGTAEEAVARMAGRLGKKKNGNS
jgi:hypothetical protein